MRNFDEVVAIVLEIIRKFLLPECFYLFCIANIIESCGV